MIVAGSTPFHAIQLYHLELDGGRCELAAPDPCLAQLIDYYWLLTVSAASIDLQVIPDAAIDLVISLDIEGFAALYLPVARMRTIPIGGPVRFAGVCFRPDRTRDLLGLGPKRVQRVLRLQAALAELLTSDEATEQDLYFDDSHRIRELKRLTGFTPGQIRRMAETYNHR